VFDAVEKFGEGEGAARRLALEEQELRDILEGNADDMAADAQAQAVEAGGQMIDAEQARRTRREFPRADNGL